MYISGGENVYPAEVENVLARHPAVQEAAVIGVADEKWGEAVTAIVVPRGAPPSAEELTSYCRGKIAGYKVPKSVFILPEIPRLGSGKPDRRALAALEPAATV